MRTFLFTVAVALATSVALSAQSLPVSILNIQDTVIVDINESKQIIFKHNVAPGQTIYSLSRQFGCTASAIFKLNNLDPEAVIAINQEIQIPIKNTFIDPSIYPDLDKHIPVLYYAKKSETLYSIAQVYFRQPVENLIARNNISGFHIDINQGLLVGWIEIENKEITVSKAVADELSAITEQQPETPSEPTGEIQEEIQDQPTGIQRRTTPFKHLDGTAISPFKSPSKDSVKISMQYLVEQPVSLDSIFAEPHIEEINLTKINMRGIALWDKNAPDDNNLFVLHHKAKLNSMIELRNPRNNRSVFARVVGNIPGNVYPSDVKVIMSPGVAKQLIILDKRALVEMIYFQ